MANESSGKKALKAGLGYTVGNMLVKGLSFLAIPLFARLMTVEDFGIYSTFSSYVMIMTVLAGFTLHTSVRNAKLDYVDLTGSYCSSVTLLVIGNSLLLLALSLVFAAPLARSLSLEQPYLPALIVLESFGKGGAVRRSLVDTARQAGAFLSCYRQELTPDQQALLADYAAAPEKGKLARLTLYRRRGLWKYGLNRRIGQILWW